MIGGMKSGERWKDCLRDGIGWMSMRNVSKDEERLYQDLVERKDEKGSRSMNSISLPVLKVALIGESFSGKTSIMHRVCRDEFEQERMYSIGLDFLMSYFRLKNEVRKNE